MSRRAPGPGHQPGRAAPGPGSHPARDPAMCHYGRLFTVQAFDAATRETL